MHVCRNLFFLILAISLLSACSVTQSIQSPPGTSSVTRKEKSDRITFINDITIKRDGHVSSQNVKGFHSPTFSRGIESSTTTSVASSLQMKYGQLLGVAPQDIDDSSLFSFIDAWYGTPYRLGGDSQNGIDCSAFVQILYSTVFGIASLPRTAQEQYEDSKKIKHIHKLKEGDLVFFRIHSRRINHVGVYLQNDKFVNASVSSGVTIYDLNDPYWRRYFAGGGVPEQAAEAGVFVASE